MRFLYPFLIIALIAGSILAGCLKLVQIIFHDDTYILLFNMDYIPLLKQIDHITGSGYLFHFVFCFVSVVGLYYMARIVHLSSSIVVYVLVYTVGSGLLYFLTALTDQPPHVTSITSWFFWVIAHAIFGLVVGMMVKYWLIPRLKRYDP